MYNVGTSIKRRSLDESLGMTLVLTRKNHFYLIQIFCHSYIRSLSFSLSRAHSHFFFLFPHIHIHAFFFFSIPLTHTLTLRQSFFLHKGNKKNHEILNDIRNDPLSCLDKLSGPRFHCHRRIEWSCPIVSWVRSKVSQPPSPVPFCERFPE